MLQSLDPRLKILMTVFLGSLVWKMDAPVLGAWVLLLVVLTLRTLPSKRTSAIQRVVFLPLVFWVVLALVLDALEPGVSWTQAVQRSSLLALRMLFLLLWGRLLVETTGMVDMAPAVVWILRSVLGRSRAWKIGAALGIMLQSIPRMGEIVQDVRMAAGLRLSGMHGLQRFPVLGAAVVRNMAAKSLDQALALASRNLDRPEAWEAEQSGRTRDWFLGLGLLLATLVVTCLP